MFQYRGLAKDFKRKMRQNQRCRAVEVANSRASTLEAADMAGVCELAVSESALASLNTESLGSLAILEISNCPLTELNTAHLGNLKLLVLWGTQIGALNLRPLSQLRELDVSWTRIRRVDLRWVPELEVLGVYKVARMLDFSRCLQIKEIDASEAAVERICVARWRDLEKFDAEFTGIKYLDFRGTNVVRRLQEPRGVLDPEPEAYEARQGVGMQLAYYDEGYGVGVDDEEIGGDEIKCGSPLA